MIRTGLYGAKNHLILNSLCLTAKNEAAFFSADRSKRLILSTGSEQGDLPRCLQKLHRSLVVMGFDNEVMFAPLSRANDPISAYLYRSGMLKPEEFRDLICEAIDELTTILKQKFTEEEEIYVVPAYGLMTDHVPSAKTLEDKFFGKKSQDGVYSVITACWPGTKFELMPLAVKDYREAKDKMKKPDYAGVETNPFVIEKRKLEFKTLDGWRDFLFKKIGASKLLYWSSQRHPTKKSFISYISELAESSVIVEEWLKNLRQDEHAFDGLIDIVQKMKRAKDWVDPSIVARNFSYYRELL